MKSIIDNTFFGYIYKKILYQLLCCISPALMGVIISSTTAKDWILNHVSEDVKSLLTTGWMQIALIIIGSVVIPSVVFVIIERIEFKNKKFGYDTLLYLMSNIDNVVEEKRKRYKKVKELNFKSDGTIFRNISKPQDQIKSLCKAFCLMMRFLTNDDAVKSSIFYCKEMEIGEVLAVCGEDSIKSNLKKLNEKSLAKSVIEDGKAKIINDTDNDECFYKPKGCKAKSALALPVYDGDKLLFVVCFSSPQKGCFEEKKLERYEKIIEEISDRILLEWHLYELLKLGKNEKKKQQSKQS